MDRVLIIDDALDFLEEVAELLHFEGFEILQASDGPMGVQIARDKLPDIIICDINMPAMDGFEVLEILRNDSLTANIPFIFLTARTHPEDIRTSMQLGADDYLTKPITQQDLVKTIHTRLASTTTRQMKRLREFSHRLVTIQETERRYFATTLKEQLGDRLSDLKITLDMVKRLPSTAQGPVLETAETLVNEATNIINRLSHAMWPSILSHLGILPAILLLIDQLQQTENLQIEFKHHGLEAIKSPDQAINLYRIIQEGLNNTAQHAEVDHVEVRLWVETGTVRLQIQDKGVGFDVDQILNEGNHAGIISMQERANLLNGELTVISAKNQGTQIFGIFPLETDTMLLESKPRKAPALSQTPKNIAKPQSAAKKQISVAIADANEITCWGLRSLLNTQPDFTVKEEIARWPDLLNFLNVSPVDILIISLTLPEEASQDAILELSHQYPDMRILVMSNYLEYAYADEALKNGAHGYLLKTSSGDEIIKAFHALAANQQYIAKDVLASVTRSDTNPTGEAPLDAFATLTDREREIFYQVVNGKSNQEIANKLFISVRTVEAHRLNMMRKLSLKGVPALLHYAMERGILGGNT